MEDLKSLPQTLKEKGASTGTFQLSVIYNGGVWEARYQNPSGIYMKITENCSECGTEKAPIILKVEDATIAGVVEKMREVLTNQGLA